MTLHETRWDDDFMIHPYTDGIFIIGMLCPIKDFEFVKVCFFYGSRATDFYYIPIKGNYTIDDSPIMDEEQQEKFDKTIKKIGIDNILEMFKDEYNRRKYDLYKDCKEFIEEFKWKGSPYED